MKKYLLLTFFIFGACAIHGEVFRLQNRMEALYELLDDNDEKLFAAQKITELGMSLDTKAQTNENFNTALRNVRIHEAIMSFDGEQTAHFFYHVLLRDLAKFSYNDFFNSLTSEEKILFITQDSLDNYTQKTDILAKAKKNYGFKSFSDEQVLNYYKNISFPANYYPIVYETLAFLARYRSLETFLQEDYTGTLVIFDNIKQLSNSRRIPIRKQGEKDLQTWQELKNRVYMSDLSDEQFLKILSSVLPKMDTDVYTTTINNIINRFKEQ